MFICEKEKCAACYACVNVCNKNAISMKEDKCGNLYPEIDENLCVNCGMCKKVCPANNKLDFKTPKEVYAAWALDMNERRSSTSGGAATVFSKEIIKEGGVVFGAALSDDLTVKHLESTSEDIKKLKGSKYVQSKIEDAYRKVKADLQEDKPVVFIGTPCQSAGLKAFLGKKEYEKLVTIDLVCHGVPSNKLLRDYIKEKGIKQYDSMSFRDSKGFNLVLKYKNTEVLNEPMDKCEYYKGFMSALFYRENCYKCPYAQPKRISDITIGDFWGLGKEKEFKESIKGGVSLVLINTEKGKKLFDKCKDEFYFQARPLSEAVNGNSQLREASKKHKNYELFRKLYLNKNIKYAVKRSLLRDDIAAFSGQLLRKNEIIHSILRKIKHIIK